MVSEDEEEGEAKAGGSTRARLRSLPSLFPGHVHEKSSPPPSPAHQQSYQQPTTQASRVLAQLLVAGATTLARAATQAWMQALQS
jgi:hypothetical protein